MKSKKEINEQATKLLLGTLIRWASAKTDVDLVDEMMQDDDMPPLKRLSLLGTGLGALNAVRKTKLDIEKMVDDLVERIKNGDFETDININRLLADVQNDITKNMNVFFNRIQREIEQKNNK